MHTAIVVGAFLVVFLLLMGVVWRAERVIQEQHRRNLDLVANAADAEAVSRVAQPARLDARGGRRGS